MERTGRRGGRASLWMIEHRSTAGHLRSRLRRRDAKPAGARFALAGADLGSVRSRGIAPGLTPLRREIGFGVWRDGRERDDALQPRRAEWARHARAWWEIDLVPVAARGSWHGDPLDDVAAPSPGEEAPLAVLTLGRTPPARFPEFTLRELPRIARDAQRAPGLLLAAAGGSPLTGSVTFTAWRDIEALHGFARARGSAHARTVRNDARRGLLVEQLILRFAVVGAAGDWGASTDRQQLVRLADALSVAG